MLFFAKNWDEVLEKLEWLVKNAECGEVIVCAATWSEAKQMAYWFESSHSDPKLWRDIDQVKMKVGGTTITFMSVDRVRCRGKCVLAYTKNMFPEVIDRLKPYEGGMAEEVFVMAQTPEDAARIEEMNSEEGTALKASRRKYIEQKGVVNEVEFPDTQACIATELERRKFTVREVEADFGRLDVKISHKGLVGYIRLDGQDVRGVKRCIIDNEVLHHPRITLEL